MWGRSTNTAYSRVLFVPLLSFFIVLFFFVESNVKDELDQPFINSTKKKLSKDMPTHIYVYTKLTTLAYDKRIWWFWHPIDVRIVVFTGDS